jgi:glycosyltransferase involved in cell wall biosynthesis
MSDSQRHDARRIWPKEAYKSWLVKQCDAALVAGNAHANYLVTLGMGADRIKLGYDVVDNDHFAVGAEAARRGGDVERRLRGLPVDYFLCIARFVAKKSLAHLLDAYRDYRGEVGGRAWKLVWLGDGPLRPALEKRIRQLALEPDVLTPGFKQYGDLPSFYAFAKALLLPSRIEQWGLVVNEAMAASVPALVSNACGSSQLVEHGRNGWLFDPAMPGELTRRLLEIHRLGPALDSLGKAARETIGEWGPERFGQGLAEALEAGDRYRLTMRSVGSRK